MHHLFGHRFQRPRWRHDFPRLLQHPGGSHDAAAARGHSDLHLSWLGAGGAGGPGAWGVPFRLWIAMAAMAIDTVFFIDGSEGLYYLQIIYDGQIVQ